MKKMSTAVVSAFYDYTDLYMNRNHLKNSLSNDRRAVGGPVNCPRNRNYSVGSFSSLCGTKPGSANTTTTPTLISFSDSNHANREVRKLDRSLSEPGDRTLGNSNNNSSSSSSQVNINSNKYKTELCRSYEESRHCKYGEKCRYAHGIQELRTPARHPKYKTELCRTFHTIGLCPYGPRCHFIHNENERKLNQQISHKEQQQQQQQNNNAQQQQQTSRHTPPPPPPPAAATHHRPKSVKFNSSLSSLGSIADSPPSSVTDSPTLSPTFFGEDLLTSSSSLSAFSPPNSTSSSPPLTSAFDFPGADISAPSSLLSPLNIQTQLGADNFVNYFDQQFFTSLTLNQRNNNNTITRESYELFGAPPSPPDSISGESSASGASFPACESPLEIWKTLQLGLPTIFSRHSDM